MVLNCAQEAAQQTFCSNDNPYLEDYCFKTIQLDLTSFELSGKVSRPIQDASSGQLVI